MDYLIFDTETNGLPKTWNASVHKLDNWPRLVQLAWTLYDEKEKAQINYSKIIRPSGFIIPDEVARTTTWCFITQF